MSWMAELSSYRYLAELKRRYRSTDLDPAARPAAESSPANGASGCRGSTGGRARR